MRSCSAQRLSKRKGTAVGLAMDQAGPGRVRGRASLRGGLPREFCPAPTRRSRRRGGWVRQARQAQGRRVPPPRVRAVPARCARPQADGRRPCAPLRRMRLGMPRALLSSRAPRACTCPRTLQIQRRRRTGVGMPQPLWCPTMSLRRRRRRARLKRPGGGRCTCTGASRACWTTTSLRSLRMIAAPAGAPRFRVLPTLAQAPPLPTASGLRLRRWPPGVKGRARFRRPRWQRRQTRQARQARQARQHTAKTWQARQHTVKMWYHTGRRLLRDSGILRPRPRVPCLAALEWAPRGCRNCIFAGWDRRPAWACQSSARRAIPCPCPVASLSAPRAGCRQARRLSVSGSRPMLRASRGPQPPPT